MKILGIETSCDETAAAVVTDQREVLSSVVASQLNVHAPYGGVVPELASRQHVRDLPRVAAEALQRAQIGWDFRAVLRGDNPCSCAQGGSLLPIHAGRSDESFDLFLRG